MAIEYRDEQVAYKEKLIKNLIHDAPMFLKKYYDHIHHGHREISTQLSYLRDIMDFLWYEKNVIPSLENINIDQFPVTIFDSLDINDLNEYRNFLKEQRHLSNASIRKIFASLSSLYHYLNMQNYTSNNPMTYLELPAVNRHRILKLTSSLSNQLLEGILLNDRYLLVTKDNEKSIIPISESVRIKREKLVLRNYAICCLFLGTGLRVSELVGIDLEDLDLQRNSVSVVTKGGDENEVFFSTNVSNALQDYINGLPLPQDIYNKYTYTNEDLIKWCKEHMSDVKFAANFDQDFPGCDAEIKRDALNIRNAMLRQGRSSLAPKKGNHALFISTRGTRMSVRSVELMVKEMAQTYIPEYKDKDKFSPHKLRATCATRILSQTGDLSLASTQLNHKNIATTAGFYASVQKEKNKEKIQNLDIYQW